MRVEFLYWEDCPSHPEALERLREVMAEEGVKAEIEVIHVGTTEEAQRRSFPGSPTIRFNGTDAAPPVDQLFGLTCRIYLTDDGRVTPLPSKAQIRRALRSAVGTQEV